MLDEITDTFRHAVYQNTVKRCDSCKGTHAPRVSCERHAEKIQIFQLITSH